LNKFWESEIKLKLQFLFGALETQPSVAGMGAGGTSLQMLHEIAQEVLDKLPENFNLRVVGEKYPFDYNNSMNTVLRQVKRKRLFYFLDILLRGLSAVFYSSICTESTESQMFLFIFHPQLILFSLKKSHF
jgi:hypothetical protein